jgi:hypothetical protein
MTGYTRNAANMAQLLPKVSKIRDENKKFKIMQLTLEALCRNFAKFAAFLMKTVI